MNVVATPGEVFEQVREQPTDHANWWLPFVLLCLAGIISTFVIFSQPSILQTIREAREQALEQQLAKVPPAQQQQVRNMAEMFSGPTALKLFGTFFSVAGSAAWLFGSALVIWAIGVIFYKAGFSYVKAMEASGLALVILLVGSIVGTLLILATGKVGIALSPAVFLSKYDPTNPAHLILNSLNVITLWYLGVLAIGLGKLSRRSALVPGLCLYGIWALVKFGLLAFGIFAQRLNG
jgi:hypothetical protein